MILSAAIAMTISIHALLAESDALRLRQAETGSVFLSTLSLRRATANVDGLLCVVSISIHALLAESDPRHFKG